MEVERNTPRSNLLAAIKSLSARAEHDKRYGPADCRRDQLEAISIFEREAEARGREQASRL
jgi:hypothetical protein